VANCVRTGGQARGLSSLGGALREITKCLSGEQSVDQLISPPFRFTCISNIVNNLVTSNWQVLNENGWLEKSHNCRLKYG
jgi:hypothetical protein